MVREEIGAHGRESWDRVQAIWKAIDDYAELETGNRESAFGTGRTASAD